MSLPIKLTVKKIWAIGKILFYGILFLFFFAIILNMFLSLFLDFSGSSGRFNFGPNLVRLLFALVIGEVLLRKFIPRYYFRYGIPILRREFSLFAIQDKITSLASLPQLLESKGLKPQIEIKYLNELEYGLWPNAIQSRDRLFRRRMVSYSPITRGYLNLDSQNSVLKLRVYINWFALPFLIIWFGIAFQIPSIHLLFKVFFISFGVFIVMKLYSGEKDQYLKIWEAVRRFSYSEYDAGALKKSLQ